MHHVKSEPRNQMQFYCLDQMVEPDSFVRIIDFFVDSIDLKSFVFKNVTLKSEGRPPIHPAQLLKLYIYGYRYGVRSSRKLEREAQLNIEARWLLGEIVPSNKTIANFRKDNAEGFRAIFRKFVFLLKQLDLIEGKTIAIDSFKVRAQNSLKNNYNQGKIDRHLDYIDNRINEFEQALDKADKGYHTGEQIHECEHNVAAYKISPMQSKCTTSKKNGRNIDRSEYASLMVQNAERVNQHKDYYKQRQQLAEHPRGTIKRQRGFDHVLTRGKTNVLGEVSLVFIGYNLTRCANIVDGLEKFKSLIFRRMNASNSLFRL